jgi:hypothetical protein
MDTHIDTQTDGRDLRSTMLSGLRCHDIPGFIKTGSAIQKLILGVTQTHRWHGDHICLLSFLKNNEK